MTLVVPAGHALVLHSLVLTGDPDPYAITYGVQQTCTDVDDANDLASQLHALYGTEIAGNNPSILTLTETVVKCNIVTAPAEVVGIAATPLAGGGGSSSLVPQNTALLVHKRTGFGGRTGRGRMYFPALNEANVNQIGEIAPAWIATMNSALDDWLTAMPALAFCDGMVLLHDSAGAGAALDPYFVSSLTVDSQAATQRRRLRH